MPVEVAAPKTTGGGGFNFADKVCAYWMAHMVAGAPPLAPPEGLLESLHFETRPDGWYLDDVLLTLRQRNDTIRAAVSIKSNIQFGASSAYPLRRPRLSPALSAPQTGAHGKHRDLGEAGVGVEGQRADVGRVL
jgi:hypothetical protein